MFSTLLRQDLTSTTLSHHDYDFDMLSLAAQSGSSETASTSSATAVKNPAADTAYVVPEQTAVI